jgi:hypothetical protein
MTDKVNYEKTAEKRKRVLFLQEIEQKRDKRWILTSGRAVVEQKEPCADSYL